MSIPLATEFSHLHFEHKQVYRSGAVAVYERRKSEQSRSHFEVIRVRTQKPYERFGKVYPAAEVYPTANQWGIFGFTFRDLESALAKAATLLRPVSKDSPQNASASKMPHS